jgi:hypothetical protein
MVVYIVHKNLRQNITLVIMLQKFICNKNFTK